MARTPRAATALFRQLGERYKNPTMEPTDEPDGFGVHRAFRFDKTSSKFLAKVLPEMDDDRIASFSEKGGQITVTFDHRSRADLRDPFPLDDAETVAETAE